MQAIGLAVRAARAGDVVLIAGKGWKIERVGSGSVVCRFTGHLDEPSGRQSVDALAELLKACAWDVVFDVTNMTGYDSGARRAWQVTLMPLKDNIRTLRILGGSSMVRMGASALALALGIRVAS